MKKVIIFLTIISAYLISPSTAQPLTADSILGNWTLYRHSIDSILIFDADNPQIMVNYNLTRLKKLKPDYTAADSLQLIERVTTGLSEFKKVFIQFNRDSTYTNRKIKGGGKMTNEIEGGKYIFNVKDQTITQTDQTGRIVIMKISVEKNILQLVFDYGSRFKMEYKRT
jgi:hypothetical protein